MILKLRKTRTSVEYPQILPLPLGEVDAKQTERVFTPSGTACHLPQRGRMFAFTLAEVLITLGVIGVVAAITMPTLVQNYQKQATVNQLKKAYSEFAQIIQKNENEFGLLETWNFENYETALERNTYFADYYLFPHIKTIKKCVPTSNECWADNIVNVSGNERTTTYVSNSQESAISFITPSGQSVFFWLHGTGTGMWYWVDLNGKDKGPNKIGHDIFAFIVNWGNSEHGKLGVFPAGAHSNYTRENIISGQELGNNKIYACTKGGIVNQGGFCSAVIMLDGWKISDDYPW